jgi:transcription initiation factor TFIIB
LVYQLKSKLVCTECGGNSLIRDYESGELVCQSCGYVIQSTSLSQEPEWRAFDQEQRDKLQRVGAPSTWTMHDKGLSTMIGYEGSNSAGRRLSLDERAKLYRLRKWHRRSKVSDSTQRNLANALSEMSKISYRLNLPRNVVETSSMIYRRAIQKHLIRGRTIQSVVVATIYVACRQCGISRTLEDVADAAGITRKEAARNYRFLLKELKPSVPQVNPQSYISKIVSKLALTGETEMLAMVIHNLASELKLTNGRGPSGMAAASVYIGCQIMNERKTQGEIARIAQVTEVTLRNRYKELAQLLNFTISL